jgi:hypothetical protein
VSEAPDVQFDKAEFEETAAAQTTCAECNGALAGYYYDVNGRTVCERCRYTIESRFNSGSGAGRFARAFGLGLVAAALGSALYYGVGALTGYEFGLIAIVVGLMVGAAVRRGSNGRGGWAYQGLAIALTYLAIVSTYVPPILEGISEMEPAQAAVEQVSLEQPPPAEVEEAISGPAAVAIAVAIIFVIACAAPFLAGVQNIIGIVIIGIGLYEAWKMNRRATLTISGPHALAAAAAEPAGA